MTASVASRSLIAFSASGHAADRRNVGSKGRSTTFMKAGNGWAPGATLSATTLNELARTWWWTRLDPGWRPRAAGESQAILSGVGLVGDFWQLA